MVFSGKYTTAMLKLSRHQPAEIAAVRQEVHSTPHANHRQRSEDVAPKMIAENPNPNHWNSRQWHFLLNTKTSDANTVSVCEKAFPGREIMGCFKRLANGFQTLER